MKIINLTKALHISNTVKEAKSDLQFLNDSNIESVSLYINDRKILGSAVQINRQVIASIVRCGLEQRLTELINEYRALDAEPEDLQ